MMPWVIERGRPTEAFRGAGRRESSRWGTTLLAVRKGSAESKCKRFTASSSRGPLTHLDGRKGHVYISIPIDSALRPINHPTRCTHAFRTPFMPT